MLYFRALQQGLARLPAKDPEVRAAITARAHAVGWQELHHELARVDPAVAAQIHPHDPQRIQRALEVYELTGRPLTELLRQQPDEPFPYAAVKLIVAPSSRALLDEAIGQRFRSMLDRGLVQEVEALFQRGDLGLDKPSMRAVGYRQLWEYLEGKLSYPEMVERAIIATRQLAKRQLTWLRAENDAAWIDSMDRNLVQNVVRRVAI